MTMEKKRLEILIDFQYDLTMVIRLIACFAIMKKVSLLCEIILFLFIYFSLDTLGERNNDPLEVISLVRDAENILQPNDRYEHKDKMDLIGTSKTSKSFSL